MNNRINDKRNRDAQYLLNEYNRIDENILFQSKMDNFVTILIFCLSTVSVVIASFISKEGYSNKFLLLVILLISIVLFPIFFKSMNRLNMSRLINNHMVYLKAYIENCVNNDEYDIKTYFRLKEFLSTYQGTVGRNTGDAKGQFKEWTNIFTNHFRRSKKNATNISFLEHLFAIFSACVLSIIVILLCREIKEQGDGRIILCLTTNFYLALGILIFLWTYIISLICVTSKNNAFIERQPPWKYTRWNTSGYKKLLEEINSKNKDKF